MLVTKAKRTRSENELIRPRDSWTVWPDGHWVHDRGREPEWGLIQGSTPHIGNVHALGKIHQLWVFHFCVRLAELAK